MISMNGQYPCVPDLPEMVNSYKDGYDEISARIKEAENVLKKLKEERRLFQLDFLKTAEDMMHLYGLRRVEGNKFVTELVTEYKPYISKDGFEAEYKETLEWLKRQLPDYIEISLKPKLQVLKSMDMKELPEWCNMKSCTRLSIRKTKSPQRPERMEITSENSGIIISRAPCTVSEIASRINAAGIMTGVADAVTINKWLIHEGLIENIPESGGRSKIPTASGESIGIGRREGQSKDGGTYIVPTYSQAAQQFIIDNIDGLIEFQNSR